MNLGMIDACVMEVSGGGLVAALCGLGECQQHKLVGERDLP